ncbi:MAG: phosphoribosylaminoimidazolesuccinocarboxamide synthase [Candidatus Andersenbacteria bacterium]
MAYIPVRVRENEVSAKLLAAGLTRTHQGKVRDTYDLGNGRLLVVTTDRLSAFDILLPEEIEQKGPTLTALSIFWFTVVLKKFRNHLVAFGSQIDRYLSSWPELCRWPELRKRAVIVRKLEMVPIEAIARGYLTGTGWSDYQRDGGKVCGVQLREGLFNGAKLDETLFSPSSKAFVGHDVNLDAATVVAQHGEWIKLCTIATYDLAAEYAAKHGIILVDTKFEFGWEENEPVLADEVCTPDSSRFWKRSEWEEAARKRQPPTSYDKQIVRDWGKTVQTPFFGKQGEPLTFATLKPQIDDHTRWVEDHLHVPDEIRQRTTAGYLEIAELLTGKSLARFQEEDMHVAA